MDRVTALVALAHLKLRLERIQRNPKLLEGIDMIDIRRPIELAGMAARLKRAEKMEQDVAVTGGRYDKVLDAIDEKHAALKTHVGSLEAVESQLDQVIARMVAGSNGGPNDDSPSSTGSTGERQSDQVGQVITSRTDATTEDEAGA
jgi:hypothetical protein